MTTEAEGLHVALGAFSLGLGAAPLLAPRAVARLSGLSPRPQVQRVLRVIGVRELVVGTGLLLRRDPTWLWARVAQDVIDVPLASVVTGMKGGEQRARMARVTAFLVVVTVVDAAAALHARRSSAGLVTR